MYAVQCTNDVEDHEHIEHAGQERVMESRRQGSLILDEQLAVVTAQEPKTVFSSTVVAKVLETNYKKANEFYHWLIKIRRKQTSL